MLYIMNYLVRMVVVKSMVVGDCLDYMFTICYCIITNIK